jgi:hypothetical protein
LNSHKAAVDEWLDMVGNSQPVRQSVCPKLDVELVVKLGDPVAAGYRRELGTRCQRSEKQR